PTQTVLIGDGGGTGPRARYNASGITSSDSGAVALTACATPTTTGTALIPGGGATRHLDGTNYAFADGHVKWLKGVVPASGTSTRTSEVKDCSITIANAG